MTANGARTAFLMALFIGFFAVVGQALGGQQGMIIAFVFAVATNFGSYWFSDKIVLKMYKAQEVTEQQAPELYRMVDRLRQRADLPMPKVYVTPSDQPNAFATGRNPQNSAVAVTSGLVKLLNKAELEGVIAHELAHIKNRDILTSSIAATLASSITMLTYFGMFFGNRDDRGGGLSALLMIFLAPLAASLIQMSISRTREFAADRLGAEICGQPRALASALSTLHNGVSQIPMNANDSTAHMFIVNPFSGMRGAFHKLFATHPPMEERIEALLAMEGSRR